MNVLRKLVASANLPADAFPVPAKPHKPMRGIAQPPKGHRADRERAARCGATVGSRKAAAGVV